MSDFNYNNNDLNNQNNGGNKPPTQKSAIVITTIVVACIVMIFLGAKSNNVPLIMGCFFAVFVTVFIAAAVQGKNKSAKSGTAVNKTQFNKYLPLLADERTKLHPEVQRLLQYTEVQMVFFDPSSLGKAEVVNSEHVRELFLIFDEMLAQGVINGNAFGNAYGIPPAQQQTGAILNEKSQIENREKEKKKPRQKVGKVLTILGITIFLLPFLFAFLTILSDTGISQTWAYVFVFNMAPFGMIMIVVGMIFRKL